MHAWLCATRQQWSQCSGSVLGWVSCLQRFVGSGSPYIAMYEKLDPTNLHSYTDSGVAISVCLTLKAGPQMAFSKGCFLGFCLNFTKCSISKHHYWRSVPYFSGLKHHRVKLHTYSSSRKDEFRCIYIHLWIRSTFSGITFLNNLEPSSHLLFIFHITPVSKPA